MSKVVLITGGSSGIGKAIGDFLQAKGLVVYGTSRTPGNYSESTFPLVQLDVLDNLSIRNCIESVVREAGRIDVLINNAGAGITGPVEDIPETELRKNFDTNFFGPVQVMKAVLPPMRQQGHGLIINVTSIAGYMGLPYRGIYSASKGSLELLTEAIRMEIKDFGIRMTTIAPGDFATNIAAGRYHAPIDQESAYGRKYGAVLKTINDHVDEGDDPIKVAKLVYKVIQTPNPKVHYRVGSFLQKFSIVLKRILPDRIYEKMLLKHYKL